MKSGNNVVGGRLCLSVAVFEFLRAVHLLQPFVSGTLFVMLMSWCANLLSHDEIGSVSFLVVGGIVPAFLSVR